MSNVEARVSALYGKHREGIYLFLVALGLSPAVAQEVTQDVFVDLFIALQKGTEMGSERAWLYAIAGREAVNYWRRERPNMWAELDSSSSPAAAAQSREESPEAQAEHRERLGRVVTGLSRLSKERRLCLQLRMQGLRYREIAKILGVSTSTAAEWLALAVESLRKEADG